MDLFEKEYKKWMDVRIGYDDIKERPRIWIGLLQQMMGRLFGNPEQQLTQVDYLEREVIRFMIRQGRPIKLRNVQDILQCGPKYARRSLKGSYSDEGGGEREK